MKHGRLFTSQNNEWNPRTVGLEKTDMGSESTRHKPQLESLLNTSVATKVAEMLVLFAVPLVIIQFALPKAGDNQAAQQGVIWGANILMLLIVWLGLRLRGQTWAHIGIDFAKPSGTTIRRAVLLSVIVFVAALAAFLFGSIVMANIVGIPESADMSQYNYLYHNLPMLILALVGVWIVSSFGEEVIYRGFLITRIEEMGPSSKNMTRAAAIGSAVIFGLIHYQWGPRASDKPHAWVSPSPSRTFN
jgi:hypothetical protein